MSTNNYENCGKILDNESYCINPNLCIKSTLQLKEAEVQSFIKKEKELNEQIAQIFKPIKTKKENLLEPEVKIFSVNGIVYQPIGYIYLIREREFLLLNQNIYKFGKTVQFPNNVIDRVKHYKKGSEICLIIHCDHKEVDIIETSIKQSFRTKFIQHPDGHEFFEGDVDEMERIILDIIFKMKKFKPRSGSLRNQFGGTQNNVLKFGQEDLSYLTNDIYKKILEKGFKAIYELVKKIHFDEEHSQNHNIYVATTRSNEVVIFNGEDWEIASCRNIINGIRNDNIKRIKKKYIELKDELIEDVQEEIDEFLTRERKMEGMRSEIDFEIKLLLFNYRKLPVQDKNAYC